MKAMVYRGARDIRCETFEDPQLQGPTDAIVRVTACGICGSDLHIYHGQPFNDDIGYCVGHEAVGEVIEVGAGVRRVKPGDRVMVSAAVGCGSCTGCLAGQVTLCLNNAMGCYGLSSRLQGSQAEAVRVPMADFNVAAIPEGITETQALLLTDNLPTAWHACVNARIAPGQHVAVVGLGPIGLMAVEAAFVMGASVVYAIDLMAERRALATELGAVALHPDEAPAVIRPATPRGGADCVVEAVGADATLKLSIALAGRGGIVSAIGVSQTRDFNFPMALAFVKNLTFTIGTCSVQEYWPDLIALVQRGRLNPQRFVSHVMPLSQGAKAYDLFDRREDGALKMVLEP